MPPLFDPKNGARALSPKECFRRTLLRLCLTGFSLVFAVWAAVGAAPPAKPNIILMFADDLGYGDLGCYGAKDIATPNLDALARDGIKFTDGYATAHVCAPSRAGLLTGAYQQRFGMQFNTDRARYRIPDEQWLLPQALKSAGYATAHIGKWNLQRAAKDAFDEVHEIMDWEGDYWPDSYGRYTGVGIGIASSKRHGLWGPSRPNEEYLTDRLGRRACEFIGRKAGQPFFLYLAFNAVHSPWHGKKEHQERVAHLPHEVLRLYASMRLSLDENVGRILATLKQKALEENTLVVFTSDNGPAFGSPRIEGWPEAWPKDGVLAGSAGPLQGHKAQFWEGGIREPFLMRWPAKLKAGQVYEQPVSTLDLYPTFCAAAGATVPKETILDGVDLLPFLTGAKSGAPHETLFWKMGDSGAVRQGDWKLLMEPGPNPVPPRLFNLKEDIGETRDRAAEKPDLAAKLMAQWKAWGAPFPPPANPNSTKAKTKK